MPDDLVHPGRPSGVAGHSDQHQVALAEDATRLLVAAAGDHLDSSLDRIWKFVSREIVIVSLSCSFVVLVFQLKLLRRVLGLGTNQARWNKP